MERIIAFVVGTVVRVYDDVLRSKEGKEYHSRVYQLQQDTGREITMLPVACKSFTPGEKPVPNEVLEKAALERSDVRIQCEITSRVFRSQGQIELRIIDAIVARPVPESGNVKDVKAKIA